MYYATTDFKTKVELKTALEDGKQIGVFAYGNSEVPLNGTIPIAGPHSPTAKKKWYAQAIIKAGIIVDIK
jgi:hypothetical protein